MQWKLSSRRDFLKISGAGVAWSDGTPFTSNDIAFTINTHLVTPELTLAGDLKKRFKSVTVVDEQNFKVALNATDPQFVFDIFTFRADVGLHIMPAHAWQGQDPKTFKFYDPDKGWPIGIGPYKLVGAMNSLNPVMRIKHQLGDTIRAHDARIAGQDVEKRIAELMEWGGLRKTVANMYPHVVAGGRGCHFANRCTHVMAECRDSAPALYRTEPNRATACHLYKTAPAILPTDIANLMQRTADSG
jgi:hypothetical protein